MAEYRRPDGPAEKSDEKDGERLQHADDRIRLRKEKFAEDQPCHLAVEQEIVPFDRRADRAGDQGTAQLPAMLGLGEVAHRNFGYRHLRFPQSTFLCGTPVVPASPSSESDPNLRRSSTPFSAIRCDRGAPPRGTHPDGVLSNAP